MDYKESPNATSALRLCTEARAASSAVVVPRLGLSPIIAALAEHPNGAKPSLTSSAKPDSRFGITWQQAGDAGDLPGTAQVVTGVGRLNNIIGTLDAGTASDISVRDLFNCCRGYS